MAGLPYPSFTDPKIIQKGKYLDEVLKHHDYDSYKWYQLQMRRALNQAIGRVIRHKDDYGCVFLLDKRFVNHTKSLSIWCQDFVKKFDREALEDAKNYEKMINECQNFFKNRRESICSDNIFKRDSKIETLGNDDLIDLKCFLPDEDKSRKRKSEEDMDSFLDDVSTEDNANKYKKPHLEIDYDVNRSNSFACSSDFADLVLTDDQNTLDDM